MQDFTPPLLSESALQVIEGAGHAADRDQPAIFIDILVDFALSL